MMDVFSLNLFGIIIPLLAAFLLVGIIVSLHIRRVPEGMICVVEHNRWDLMIWESGVHLLIPFADRVKQMVPLAVQNKTVSVEYIVAKDEVFMTAAVQLSYRITGYQFLAGGGDPHRSAEQLTESTMRVILRHMKAAEAEAERAEVERLMQVSLTDALTRLGITADSLELTALRRS